MRSTFDKGNLSLMKVMAVCSEAGYRVSLPIGDGHPYDLIIDDGSRLLRCQVKTAKVRNGCIVFSVKSNNGRYRPKGARDRTYTGKVEVFGVYAPDLDSVFLVPIENTGRSAKALRVAAQAKNRNWKNTQRSDWADSYKVVSIDGARSSEAERSVVAREVEVSKSSEHPKVSGL